jgi:hypothetical protein
MNEKELRRLLEKYYSGESTEEEEAGLREYFTGENVLSGFEAEKEIFTYYTNSQEVPEPSSGFEDRILAGIDSVENKEAKFTISWYRIPLLGAAASILILVGFYFFTGQKNELQDTYSDSKQAYAETMKILLDVSAKMNKATLALEPVAKINEMQAKSFKAIGKSTRIVERNLRSLDYLKEDGSSKDVSRKGAKAQREGDL